MLAAEAELADVLPAALALLGLDLLVLALHETPLLLLQHVLQTVLLQVQFADFVIQLTHLATQVLFGVQVGIVLGRIFLGDGVLGVSGGVC